MNPLIIFGASTRAAAFSALRAGFDPICGDMFADADLRAHAQTVLSVPDYPRQLVDAVRHLPAGTPWIYTGALENSPGEVDRLCRLHSLWGHSGDVLRRCRDPWQLAAALEQAGLPLLDLRSSADPPERDGTWLLKPLKSAAGRDIAIWRAPTKAPSEPHYFQRFVTGTPVSGAFLASDGWIHLLGVSRQLIGSPELHAPEFGYCGSIFSPADSTQLAGVSIVRQVGEVIGRTFGLRGLFGIDYVFDGQTCWMTEVNPRYTASMELIEHAYQQPLLDWHCQACDRSIDAAGVIERRPVFDGCLAKVILYADRQAVATDLSHWIPQTVTLRELPQLADIPTAGSEIAIGQPVFTCLGTGANQDLLWQDLMDRARGLWGGFPGKKP